MYKIETDSLLRVEGSIPIEIIQTSVEWQEIILNNLPFIITVLIVLTAATVTYMSNQKLVKSQNKIALKNRQEERENKISEFRHLWLQEVRETGSELIQVIHDYQFFTLKNNLCREKEEKENKSEEQLKKEMKEMEDSFNNLITARSKFYRKEAKLKLLFKKDDTEAKELFKIIDSVKNKIKLSEIDLLDDIIGNITNELQILLKKEWEVTKNRTWLKNT